MEGRRVAMCKYCEGVLGSAMIDNSSFTVRDMPIDGRLSIDHEHDRCCLDNIYDYCSIPIDYCPKCGRDLRGGES